MGIRGAAWISLVGVIEFSIAQFDVACGQRRSPGQPDDLDFPD